MDEMRLKLSTNFLKKIVSKILSKMFYKKFGYKVNIQINDLDIWMVDGDTNIKLNVETKINSEQFNQIIKDINLD